ncbi:unnamed protein product [Chrysoparadoxa australica]
MNENQCPDCKGLDIIVDDAAGDRVCRGCGMVLGDHLIDEGPEWRTFANDEGPKNEPSRIGGLVSALTSDGGLSTKLQGGNERVRRTLAKCEGMASTAGQRSDKKMLECYKRIGEIVACLRLGHSITEIASHLLKKLEVEGGFKMKRTGKAEAICAAVVYLACRQAQASRTLAEVAPAAGLKKKDVAKAFKYLEKHLKVDRGAVKAEHLVPRCCSMLGVKPHFSQAAKHVAIRASELELVDGVRPQAVAAAAIYLAAEAFAVKQITVRDIAGAALISEQNLKSTYSLLQQRTDQLLPPGCKLQAVQG